MPLPALALVARTEAARHWRALLALALFVAVTGGLVLGGVALVRRTTTVPDRLREAVEPGDVHLDLFGADIAEDVVALPQVEAWSSTALLIGRLEGPGVVYLGVSAAEQAEPEVLRPVVVEGRAADPAAADEVVVLEDMAERMGVGPGDPLVLDMLSPEEVRQFDVGFGDPDGPRVELTVTGVARVPPGVFRSSPVIATPALAEQLPGSVAASALAVRLRDEDDLGAFTGAVKELAAEVEAPAGGEEFPPVAWTDPQDGTEALLRTTRVLVVVLVVAVAVGALAALVVMTQVLSRRYAASARDQRVEAALGMTATERALARTVPVGVAALAATPVLVATAAATGSLEPPGALGSLEPEVGWRLDVVAVTAGAALVVAATAAVAFLAARAAGRDASDRPTSGRPAGWPLAPRRGGWPLVGVALALSTGDRRAAAPVRASLAGAVLGVAGVVAAATFGASLDRLVTTPERYGWEADVAVVDATDDVLAALAADERIASVAAAASAPVEVDGQEVEAQAVTPVTGDVGWVVFAGRLPASPDEVVLGRRLADRLEVEVGDEVELGDGEPAEVVGVGLGPELSGAPLGGAALVHPDRFAAVALTQPFHEAFVEVAPDVDAEVVVADLAERYELTLDEPPAEVRQLDALGSLPELLGAFLAALAVAAIAHGVTVLGHRRAGDLAVLHALGARRRQVGLAVVASSLTTVAVGIVVGAPLGWLAARLAWGEVARATGVAGDVLVPPGAPLTVLVALPVAVLVAAVPAWRASRARPAAALRAE